MDPSCLNHRLTESERQAFEKEGYFIVENALSPDLLHEVTEAMDRLNITYRAFKGLDAHAALGIHDFIGKDPIFLTLLDLPQTFLKACELLSWNIQLYHSDYRYTPPLAPDVDREKQRLRWHQDSGRLNRELEGDPRPRVSLKIAFFISDVSAPGRGNFHVIPGTHLQNKIELPDKVLFYGYSYRWLRPRDNVTADHIWNGLDPIRQQLLGASANGGFGYTSPKDEDVPLKLWMEEHMGKVVA